MQGYLLLTLLVTFQMLAVTFGIGAAYTESTDGSQDIRRKLPIFPKKAMKFVVTSPPHVKGNEKKIAAKPIDTEIEIRHDYDETTTPINIMPRMKSKTITVPSKLNGKPNIAATLEAHRRTDVFEKHGPIEAQFSEVTKVYYDNKHKYIEQGPLDIKEEGINKMKPYRGNTKFLDTIKIAKDQRTPDEFAIEEEQDRHEFIFLRNKAKRDVKDLMQDYDSEIYNKNSRIKRASNIIEEENMGTTVSGFKFTGRDTRLNHDLHYKNINS